MSLSKTARIALALVAFAFVLISIAIVGFLHFNPICGEEMGLEKTSPDGLYVAQVMIRNCGATAPYVNHINLRPAASTFHPDFWSGAIYEGEVFTTSDYSGNRFCWSKPHSLSIGYPDLRVRQWRDVSIDGNFRNLECQ